MKDISRSLLSFRGIRTLFFGALIAISTVSCESLQNMLSSQKSPELSMQAVAIKSLDMEGITFSCDYAITNPYPVAVDLEKLAADVIYNGSTFTSLTADEGVAIEASGSHSNKLSFKVPYESIISFAQSLSGKTSLPFTVKGSAAVDLSKVTSLQNAGTVSLPFSKQFDVPIFKPGLSVSNVRIELPSYEKIRDAIFKGGGKTLIQAATLATNIITGNSISSNALDGIDLDLNLLFDVDVSNAGTAPWEFALNGCSIETSAGSIADVGSSDNSSLKITEDSTIPMKASLNTLQMGAFIVQMLNKRGTNPVFSLDSSLSFTELSYTKGLPLAVSYEIPLSSITK